jgi:hypothetical protein
MTKELTVFGCYHNRLKYTDDFVFCVECGERWFSEYMIQSAIVKVTHHEQPNFNEILTEWRKHVQ